ncbi:MAG: glycine cleavage system protein R [Rhodocyclaceae bacterium]|jgi:glycine cleavage system regulatory protein|nr:glycine cleavage system protein R [Rhodocyclaceae bacterium]
MSDQNLVLTAIGDDRPGLVEELAATIAAHGGNWCEASMAQLAGKFAGIVHVSVPTERVEALNAALAQLKGLKVSVETASEQKSVVAGRHLTLTLVGHDRIGIVKEVAQVLARHAVNVEELATFTTSAPMSAEVLFHAEAELTAAPDFDVRALKRDLEKLSDDLMVDITLGETL